MGMHPVQHFERTLPQVRQAPWTRPTDVRLLEELGSVDEGRNIQAGRSPRLIVLVRDTLAPRGFPDGCGSYAGSFVTCGTPVCRV